MIQVLTFVLLGVAALCIIGSLVFCKWLAQREESRIAHKREWERIYKGRFAMLELNTDAMHRAYYDSAVWQQTYWLGTPVLKCPLDMWVYQEIIFDIKPSLILETGTFAGGSAMYFATICDLIGKGEIISIDTARRSCPEHPRVTYMHGSSIDPEILKKVHERVSQADCVLVILDSAHHFDHVIQEMRIYGELVTPGSFMIVEDTNIGGHPVLRGFGAGPWEAVLKYMEETSEYEIDKSKEKFGMSFAPNGFLKRKTHPPVG